MTTKCYTRKKKTGDLPNSTPSSSSPTMFSDLPEQIKMPNFAEALIASQTKKRSFIHIFNDGNESRTKRSISGISNHMELKDSGEVNELLDDLDYVFDGLSKKLTLTVKISSLKNLAQMCSKKDTFRVLRSQPQTFQKIFSSLQENIQEQALLPFGIVIMNLLFKDPLNCEYANEEAITYLINTLTLTNNSFQIVLIFLSQIFE
eukprot:TRINITY_DN4714_c0_g1_i2.p1 TRINITY_DN4714_c0_g1~~TRINITY_DN4714_c0_g1_i2.p1  ORF type:complete len:204 (-),score=26.92 TRINITY_DN4714_c0_g1_i2:45-656(-)